MSKKEKSSEALDVNENASTRTIRASFRKKAKLLQSGNAGVPVSKKTFQELNEAYQTLIQNRQQQKAVQTKKVTVLSSDVSEFSRMMATHEKETLAFFNFCKEVFEEIVDNWHGRVFNTAGDAILAEFEFEFNAVHCAIEIQREIAVLNRGQPEDQRILFRIGVNSGEVFLQEGDILGDTVNIAARIQTAAKPGGICLSESVQLQLADKILHSIHFLGEKNFKNIPEPIRTYAITDEDGNFKRPLPDPKMGVSSGFTPSVVPDAQTTLRTSNAATKVEPKSGKFLVPLLLVAALGGGAYYLFQDRLAPVAERKAAPIAKAAPAGTTHIFFSTQPPVDISFLLGDARVHFGSSPVNHDFAPGTYKVKMDDVIRGIHEEMELTVEAGKEQHIEKLLGPGVKPTTDAAGVTGSPAVLSPQDLEKMTEAAGNGDSEAAYRAGMHHAAAGDKENAYRFFAMAAKRDQVEAEYELAVIFYSAIGVPQNLDAAMYWFLKAATASNKRAIFFLAHHEFPPTFERDVTNQRKIEAHSAGPAVAAQQRARLDELKEILQGKGLPN